MSELADPRWSALIDREWRCSGCGSSHRGLFGLSSWRPDYWPLDGEVSPNSAVDHCEHFLSEDFCIVGGQDFFVRCVLPIPLIGAGTEEFGYGVWSSLSKVNFDHYRNHFGDPDFGDDQRWFGWLSNRIDGYPETVNLRCNVAPRRGGLRPLIELHDADHPLVREQQEGIGFERLAEIYRLAGHPPLLGL